MFSIVRITAWALAGGLWGAALASSRAHDASAHTALVGASIGVAAGAAIGLAMQALMRWTRIRRRRKKPHS